MSLWVAGADGCPAGWLRAARNVENGAVSFALCQSAVDLLSAPPCPAILCIDIPIGLTDQGPRDCDRRAREFLKPLRHASVFSAPIRPALAASSHEQASRMTQSADGRRVSAQSWQLYRKIREVDALFDRPDFAAATIAEVHPEVSFAAWAGYPMTYAKKSPQGRAERLKLAERWLGRGILDCARGDLKRREVADDDILDAIAALWTANRIHEGKAQVLGNHRSHDSRGRPMRIVY